MLVFPAPFALILGIFALRDLKAHPEKRGMGRTVFALIMGGLGSAVLLFLVSALILGILRERSRLLATPPTSPLRPCATLCKRFRETAP